MTEIKSSLYQEAIKYMKKDINASTGEQSSSFQMRPYSGGNRGQMNDDLMEEEMVELRK